MSEIINNSRKRVDHLKELLLDLHKGISVEKTKEKLKTLMAQVPYGEVVTAEEELIREGLKHEEILKFCDLHTEAMKEQLSTEHAKSAPEGHPIHTFILENREIQKLLSRLKHIKTELENDNPEQSADDKILLIKAIFNDLTDINKHYERKENLVFPYLEKYEITGPPMVMWGKHDEIRSFLKSSLELLQSSSEVTAGDVVGFFDLMFDTLIKAVDEMIYKEENILFPMCMDTLTEIDWYQVYEQSDEIGYCLAAPEHEWKPGFAVAEKVKKDNGRIQLSTGSFTAEELEGIFGSLPVDITYVDKEDKVRFFSHGEDRIFQRNKAILGRQVQYCHPPASVNIVDQILNDFKSGRQSSAKFWINIKNMMVHIAYYAVRNPEGEYLGTLEVTQDIKGFKQLEGERRLLTYDTEKESSNEN